MVTATPIPAKVTRPIAPPAWRVRAMLRAVQWSRDWRIPYSPFVAVKAL